MRSAFASRCRLLVVLVAASVAAPAASAEAATFSVNSIGTGSDVAIDGSCDTDATADVDCSLRAAIEEANATTPSDTIVFQSTASPTDPDDVAFDLTGSPQVIGGTLPTITHALFINGQDCEAAPDLPATPCLRLNAPIAINADGEVNIRGLSFSGAGTAIDVIHVAGTSPGVPDFVLNASWFGIDPVGVAQVPPDTAVLLEDVSGAQIGGSTRGERNLFARQGTGVDVFGADNTNIWGNWFGIKPDGTFARAGEGSAANGDAIEITGDSTPNPDNQATGSKVGFASSFSATPACDGFCNLIAGAGRTGSGGVAAGSAIDLGGDGGVEIPADGASIAGNEIGPDVAPNNSGINVGDADGVVIGGASSDAANVIGANGIGSGFGSSDLTVSHNSFDGSGSGAGAISVNGNGEISDNFVASGTTQPAIQLVSTSGGGYSVTGNVIGESADGSPVPSGRFGISVNGNGNTIGGTGAGDGNVITNLTSTTPAINTIGINVVGDGNEVIGNTIGEGTDGTPGAQLVGIQVGGDADDNVIGGTSAASENEIVNTTQGTAVIPAAAIRVVNQSPAITSSGDQILRNVGSDNDGQFIDLGEDGPGNVAGGPNLGIQAPAISTALATGATGTAAPNAVVRIFSKAISDAGELQGFVAETTSAADGSWSVGYPAQVIGQRLVATATTVGGTSELSAVASVSEPVIPPPAGDTDPPETTIVKAPKGKIKSKKAKFVFSADEQGATFTCTIDKGGPKPCTSPLTLKRLKKGKHSFSVFATDAAGNADPTPATSRFKVKRKKH
ncbi:MAG: hypothetical protein KDB58_05580 [Solirubrobacterales bacterium]|nr:hypothetical protein [Solirubrobacterales bacterium]MCB8971827.1 hypothetical protein [Thermoleophilales bacterium]MCO5326368.1 hypothetical protein [Solirubrobacterales bacterium]